MKILVCVKQVPDPAMPLTVSEDGPWIRQENRDGFRMNRFDRFALEEARLIREGLSPQKETLVDAISVGPPRAASTLRRAMAMGADRGIHIVRKEDRYMGPFDTASLVAGWARDKGYHMILAGVMAEDDMHCLVGQLIGETLGYALATSVIHLEIIDEGRGIYVEREVESGRRECLRMRLPAVLTVQPGINSPGYPSLSNMLRAVEQEIIRVGEDAVKLPEPREDLISLREPEITSRGVFLQGTLEEKASKLAQILRSNSLI